MPVAWTDELIDNLRELWRQGFTCLQIAQKLGFTSRSVVSGKLWRLGIDAGAKENTRSGALVARVRKARERKVKPPPKAPKEPPMKFSYDRTGLKSGPAKAPPPLQPALRCEDIYGIPQRHWQGCSWIEGEVRNDTLQGQGWYWCNAPRRQGSSWCPHHHARVYK